jgi:hypothetical protein
MHSVSGNLSCRKVLFFYEDMGLIFGIFKIYVCVSLDYNFYNLLKKKNALLCNYMHRPFFLFW